MTTAPSTVPTTLQAGKAPVLLGTSLERLVLNEPSEHSLDERSELAGPKCVLLDSTRQLVW